MFLHDIAKGRIRIIGSPARASRGGVCPRLGFSAAETDLVAWLIEVHLVMSTVAQVARFVEISKTIEISPPWCSRWSG